MSTHDDPDALRHGNLDAPVELPPHLGIGYSIDESPLGPILTTTIRPMAPDTAKRAPRDDKTDDSPTTSTEQKPRVEEPLGEPPATTYAGSAQHDAIELNTETHGNHARNTRSDI